MSAKIRPGLLLCLTATIQAQQVPDRDFRPAVAAPAFTLGQGPAVLIDEAHFNFHTSTGRFLAFAELLRRDGYRVEPVTAALSAVTLRRGRILVISNALHERNSKDWSAPNPSAFTDDEIAALAHWVKSGGSLLLIADHAPFSAAASRLAQAFGFQYRDGYVSVPGKGGAIVFRKAGGTLREHEVTGGIDSVATFTGSSFVATAEARPLLVFGPDAVSRSGRQDPGAVPVAGHLQGAVAEIGSGRVAAFGEAAMFTAQLAGPSRSPMGMNAPVAKQNAQFVLNVIHWLTRR